MARPGLEPGPTTARASRRRLAKCCQDNQLTNAASPACWQHDACEGRRTRCVCCPSYRNSAEAWRSWAPCACAAGGSSSVRIAPSCSARGAQSSDARSTPSRRCRMDTASRDSTLGGRGRRSAQRLASRRGRRTVRSRRSALPPLPSHDYVADQRYVPPPRLEPHWNHGGRSATTAKAALASGLRS